MTGRRLRRGNWSVQELERLRHLLPRRGVDDTARLLRRSPESVRRKAHTLLAVAAARRTPWTAFEELQLRSAWGALELRLLSVMLGRPAVEVSRRAAALAAQPRQGPWTRGEDRLLKSLYGTRTDQDLEVCLQRRAADIAAAAARLCLSKDKRFSKARLRTVRTMPRWSAAEVERLRAIYPDHDNLLIAAQLQRTVASVANKAFQLGLQKSTVLLARIGRNNVAVRYGDGGKAAAGTAENTAGG